MAVPEEIRKVERPVNTIVEDRGKDGPFRYAVRERSGVRYVRGGNPMPRNGHVIGHIIDGRFVPVKERTAQKGADSLSYGSSRLIRDLSADILSDLLSVYRADDAQRILVIAALRIIKPEIRLMKMAGRYSTTFLSIWWPGLALSENTISSLFQKVGMDGAKRKDFYVRRMNETSSAHHIVIDGTLKQDTSVVNDLSAYSHKARVKGCADVSVLYAYDLERKEPICAEVFPGNFIDATSYPAFIEHNSITRGIIVADKGFPPSKIAHQLEMHPDLHFLTPIKRNDSRIAANGMLEWQGVLRSIDRRVAYCRKRIKGGRWLYAFKDMGKAHGEENLFFDRLLKDSSAQFSMQDYDKTMMRGGVMVFESDLETDAESIYRCYADRWKLEMVFRRYKSDECLDKTRVEGDFTLRGSEFVNFISTLITCRIVERMENTDLLKEMTYQELMEDLTDAWRLADAPEEAHSDDGSWVHVSEGIFPELEAMGLSIPVPKPTPKKRGRPRKNPLPDPVAPKKKRGRPPKKKVEG